MAYSQIGTIPWGGDGGGGGGAENTERGRIQAFWVQTLSA